MIIRNYFAPARRWLFRHWALLAALAVFAIVGLAVFDDYGVSGDEVVQRQVARDTLDYALGRESSLLENRDQRYGVAFELPLLLFTEHLLGLEDSRRILLARHLLTHLFFLAGGVFCYLLAWRLCNSRLLALAALLLFLLHPRLYAQSFNNTKDLPFLAMFMLSLYWTHRAFQRNTAGAFILCGVAVGLLTGVRVMGTLLFVAVLGLRLLDLLYAPEGRRRAVAAGAGAFALAAAGTLYASWPWLWSDPLGRFSEGFRQFANYPHQYYSYLHGELVSSLALPWHYAPSWFALTAPPAALLLGLAGIAALLWAAAYRPGRALRNTRLRFGLLCLAMFIAPVLAVIVLDSTLYRGWKHLYFIWAPFCIVCLFGLHWAGRRLRPRWRTATGVIAVIAILLPVAVMTQLHPYQMAYFNLLVDRAAPERLRTQYDMYLGGAVYYDALRFLLARYPETPIHLQQRPEETSHIGQTRLLLPPEDRPRVLTSGAVDFVIVNYLQQPPASETPAAAPNPTAPLAATFNYAGLRAAPGLAALPGTPVYNYQIFHNTVATVLALDPALAEGKTAPANGHWRLVQQSLAPLEPAARAGGFAIYHTGGHTGGRLVYVKENCAAADAELRFFLHIYPTPDARRYLPESRQPYGYANLDFSYYQHGGWHNGTCLAAANLPNYPLAAIHTGQYSGSQRIWQTQITPNQE